MSPSTSVVLTSQLLARQGVGAGNILGKVLYNPNSNVSIEARTSQVRSSHAALTLVVIVRLELLRFGRERSP